MQDADDLAGGTIYEPVPVPGRSARMLSACALAAPLNELADRPHDHAGIIEMDIMVGVQAYTGTVPGESGPAAEIGEEG